MALKLIASPGAGVSFSPIVTRMRLGVPSNGNPEIETGAISRRGPPAPGLTTSTTKPSMRRTVRSPVMIGAATRSLRTFAAKAPAAPKAVRLAKATIKAVAPRARSVHQAPVSAAAMAASSIKEGSRPASR